MTLFEFTNTQSVANWLSQNDTVMGGLSLSQLSYLDSGLVSFHGKVSLENNGGFAQVKYRKTHFDLSAYTGLELKLKGDNKSYQLRLETASPGIAYSQTFFAPNHWQSVQLAFDSFKATFRGRDIINAPKLTTNHITAIGLLISDKQEGAFELLLSSIKAYSLKG